MGLAGFVVADNVPVLVPYPTQSREANSPLLCLTPGCRLLRPGKYASRDLTEAVAALGGCSLTDMLTCLPHYITY